LQCDQHQEAACRTYAFVIVTPELKLVPNTYSTIPKLSLEGPAGQHKDARQTTTAGAAPGEQLPLTVV
jgi:hypothetical protein